MNIFAPYNYNYNVISFICFLYYFVLIPSKSKILFYSSKITLKYPFNLREKLADTARKCELSDTCLVTLSSKGA